MKPKNQSLANLGMGMNSKRDISNTIEKLAELIHKSYCLYCIEIRGKDYWTGGDYGKLDDVAKEADRYIARFIIQFLGPRGLEIIEKQMEIFHRRIIMSEEKPNPFNIIKRRGEPNEAIFEGVKVFRQEFIYAGEFGLIPCCPYDNHFVFEVPESRQRMGMWSYWCTCGSIAGIAWTKDIKQKMMVCKFYHERLYEEGHGYHQTAVINKKDFDQIAGQTIELPKGKRWLT